MDINKAIAAKTMIDLAVKELGTTTQLTSRLIDTALHGLLPATRSVKAIPAYVTRIDDLIAYAGKVLPNATTKVEIKKRLIGSPLQTVTIAGPEGYVGRTTAPAPDAVLAMASAVINAVVDRAKREATNNADFTTRDSVNKTPAARGVIVGDTDQTNARADQALQNSKSEGKSRTSLRPVGFKAPTTGAQGGSTSGSLRQPGAAARIPAQPKR